MGKQIIGVSDQALRLLLKYDYPGNVRELENIIEHAFVLCGGNQIDIDCLPKELKEDQEKREPSVILLKEETLFGRAEADIIKNILNKFDGNRIKTAQELGIDRTTLWRKMKRYDLQ